MVAFPKKIVAAPAAPAAQAPKAAAAPAKAPVKPGLARPAARTAPAVHSHSKYASVSTAQVSVEGNYIRAGRYLAQIEKIEEGTTPMGREDFVSIHLLVLAADDSQLTVLDQRFGGGLSAVGESVSDFNKLNNIAFNQKMMAFAMVVSNLTQQEIQDQEVTKGAELGLKPSESAGLFVSAMTAEDQPFAGKFIEVTVRWVKNKDNKSVPDSEVGRDGVYPKTTFNRLVSASEVAETIDSELLLSRVPNIQELIDAEGAEG